MSPSAPVFGPFLSLFGRMLAGSRGVRPVLPAFCSGACQRGAGLRGREATRPPKPPLRACMFTVQTKRRSSGALERVDSKDRDGSACKGLAGWASRWESLTERAKILADHMGSWTVWVGCDVVGKGLVEPGGIDDILPGREAVGLGR